MDTEIRGILTAGHKKRCNLIELAVAIANAHYPDDVACKDKARVRLAFDELFLLQLGVLNKKRNWQISQPGNALKIDKLLLETFIKSLPFILTRLSKKLPAKSWRTFRFPQQCPACFKAMSAVVRLL